MSKYDGQIYLMPEDNYAQWINHGFIFRDDYAVETELTNGISNWQEMNQYLASVKEKHPDNSLGC